MNYGAFGGLPSADVDILSGPQLISSALLNKLIPEVYPVGQHSSVKVALPEHEGRREVLYGCIGFRSQLAAGLLIRKKRGPTVNAGIGNSGSMGDIIKKPRAEVEMRLTVTNTLGKLMRCHQLQQKADVLVVSVVRAFSWQPWPSTIRDRSRQACIDSQLSVANFVPDAKNLQELGCYMLELSAFTSWGNRSNGISGPVEPASGPIAGRDMRLAWPAGRTGRPAALRATVVTNEAFWYEPFRVKTSCSPWFKNMIQGH
ncbi:hypothetical protein V8F20_005747 [Naviculisporaceae sp. PSN 640]